MRRATPNPPNGTDAGAQIRNLVLAGVFIVTGALALGALAPPPAGAVLPDEVLADAALEARARALSKNLRCLVCQNQSIDDSNADLARDLRILVRERLKAGDSDEKIIAFLVARYGDFVLLKPPVRPTTWALWFGPLAIFLTAGLGLFIAARRRRARPAPLPIPLNATEQARLARILKQGNGGGDQRNSGPGGDTS